MSGHLELGSYVLGGLSPEERRAFEAHLPHCAQCQLELAQLAPVAERLRTLDAGTACAVLSQPRVVQESGVPAQLLDTLRSQRRSRRIIRRAGLIAAVAASLIAGFFLAPVLQPDPSPLPEASYAVRSSSGQQVSVGLLPKAWGTEVRFEGNGLPTAGTLSLWVVDAAGTADRAGSWSATATGKTRMTGAVPVPMEQISAVQLRAVDSTVLAEVPTSGPSG